MKKLIMFGLFLTLAGCATTNRQADTAAYDQIKKGVTTKAGVLDLLGAPMNIIKSDDGRTSLSYGYVNMYGYQTLVVSIDPDDKVEKTIMSRANQNP